MEYNEQKQERVILAGVHRGMRDALWDTTEESIHELGELVKTAGGIVVGEMIQNKADLESATYMGEGKLDELKIAIETLNADMVVFDDELSPVQMRNISDFLEIKVLDRSMLILDIFAMRAKSGEGKLQVELAQLKYRLPRLRGFGVEMSRTGAGIGTRGPGETRLESDRRHIRRRISALEEEIKELKKHRGLIRDRRKKDGDEFIWDDSQKWVLEVSDGNGGYYTLFDQNVSNGSVYYDVAENDNGTKNINVYVFTGAGTTIKQYTHTETGFSEKSVYESGAVNRVFTTIPSYK